MSIRKSSFHRGGKRRCNSHSTKVSKGEFKPAPIDNSTKLFRINSIGLMLDGLYGMGINFNESESDLKREFFNKWLDPDYQDAELLDKDREEVFDGISKDFMEFIYEEKGYSFTDSDENIIADVKADINIAVI